MIPELTPQVRAMTPEDVVGVVVVHVSSFPSYFLSSLGPRFLRRYYRSALDDASSIAFVVVSADVVQGVIVGSIDPGGFYSRLLKRHALGFAFDALPAMLRRPSTALRLMRALSKPRESGRPAGTAGVFSIAVSPDLQRTGIGKLLLNAFVHEARERRALSVGLETDADGNDQAIAFYGALGFKTSRKYETREGRRMLELSKPIDGVNEVEASE